MDIKGKILNLLEIDKKINYIKENSELNTNNNEASKEKQNKFKI